MDEYCRNFPETAALDCVSNLNTSKHLHKGDSQLKKFPKIHKIVNIQTYNFAILFYTVAPQIPKVANLDVPENSKDTTHCITM